MSPIESLLTCAIRYCNTTATYWTERYQTERTGADTPYNYSKQDYNIFPRYQTAQAIKLGLQELISSDYTDLEGIRAEVLTVGNTYETVFISDPKNQTHRKAILEEREKFAKYVSEISEIQLHTTKPLPYERKFKEHESNEWREKLKEKWNVSGEYWAPLTNDYPAAIILQQEETSPSDILKISQFIQTICQPHAILISEDRLDYEIEKQLIDIKLYEQFIFDATNSWIVYGSHEGTLAFGGERLSEFINQIIAQSHDKPF